MRERTEKMEDGLETDLYQQKEGLRWEQLPRGFLPEERTGEDGAVTATGTFLMTEGFDAASAEQLQALFQQAGFPGSIRLLPDAP